MTKNGEAGSRVLKYVTAGAAAGFLVFSSLLPRLIPQTKDPRIHDQACTAPDAGPGLLSAQAAGRSADEPVVLRVANWEEYIDLGDWDEEETIELPSGDIIGENSMIEDFEAWYEETYGKKVRVEYSTFGTNEDLYNMLTLGDVYDLVCPSEYQERNEMIMRRRYFIIKDWQILLAAVVGVILYKKKRNVKS